ncbi:nucleoporin NUP42 [Neosynchiropus ocellatus]
MPVCNFFLQGRCRYGDKCWNEHPRDGRGGGGGGGGGGGNRSYAPQQSRGGGGFGNRVWTNPNQQKPAYIQPSSFSSPNDWNRGGGGGRRDNVNDFSFSAQNRFSTLSNHGDQNRGARGDEDDKKTLESIQSDMEIWLCSGQWGFSCYSNLKAPISGFSDLSPEELRLEYYTARASGDLQNYINGVNQLLNQWRSRVEELKRMNSSTRASLVEELNNPAPEAAASSGFGSTSAPGFGSSASAFGNKDLPPPTGFGGATSFSFAPPSGGFGSSTSGSSSVFGSTVSNSSQPNATGFGSASSAVPSASSFSFASGSSKPAAAPTGFGSASGFSFTSAANSSAGFGGGMESKAPAGGSGLFGQPSSGFGAAPAAPASGSEGSLFTRGSELTDDELSQFKAPQFTLGQIPLKPPPADMLVS